MAEFGGLAGGDPAGISRHDLTMILMERGIWPFIRQLPFRDYADPESDPPAIIVSLYTGEPFQALPEVYLKGKAEIFEAGVRLLEVFAPGNVHVAAPAGFLDGDDSFGSLITETYTGPYPAGDPGTLLYHIRNGTADNRSWYINGQDVVFMARMLETGRYPTERIIALAGDKAESRCHVKTRFGVPIAHILNSFEGTFKEGIRPVIGGLFTGYAGDDTSSYMGLYDTSLTLISDGRGSEFLGFVRAGFGKPSYSRAFLSALNPSDLQMDCGMHGDRRACIACGSCNRVCPVDILPQLAFKAVLVEDVDEYLAHGLLDCVECGLCTYVCPSKIEIADILKGAKAAYYLEQA